MTQLEIIGHGPLLDSTGSLAQVGWSPQPLLDCNLENISFYPRLLHPLQRFRIKRWDYYVVFTPQRFFSATIADLGYAGNIFVYTLDFTTGELHEEGLVIPLGTNIELPRSSTGGNTTYQGKDVQLAFQVGTDYRHITVNWPGFHDGRGIKADIRLACPADHESMTIVIPIEDKRFYYNRKINCMPALGSLTYGDIHETLEPESSLGSLDWGRGVWAYSSFWNWASASGFLPNSLSVGLNLGSGFGDTSAATEDCLLLDGRVHKLGSVTFDYPSGDYMDVWKFRDGEDRLELDFTPFKDRMARTNLGLIVSEVHQVFGRYNGWVKADDGQLVEISDLIGFTEEHQAKW